MTTKPSPHGEPTRKLIDAVMYALKEGCFFPVPEPKKGATVQELIQWGAIRNLHDAIAEFNKVSPHGEPKLIDCPMCEAGGSVAENDPEIAVLMNARAAAPHREAEGLAPNESSAAWREWFDRLGPVATVDVVNATANLVIAEREIHARATVPADSAREALQNISLEAGLILVQWSDISQDLRNAINHLKTLASEAQLPNPSYTFDGKLAVPANERINFDTWWASLGETIPRRPDKLAELAWNAALAAAASSATGEKENG